MAITLLPIKAYVQQLPPKEVTHFTQFWTSINANARISDKWSMLADFHMRRNNFLKDPGFYLIRTGACIQHQAKSGRCSRLCASVVSMEKRLAVIITF